MQSIAKPAINYIIKLILKDYPEASALSQLSTILAFFSFVLYNYFNKNDKLLTFRTLNLH
ncbi:hypothetical protein PLO_0593 [Pediococcus acidilactici NGRI 0510Q]|nr:hypothetical protein IV82_GL000641 [Pediococcus acidilactici]GAC45121.1 hypothetical protein PLO_0593 [Pediococcus acidilactici NGRI 0510Q]